MLIDITEFMYFQYLIQKVSLTVIKREELILISSVQDLRFEIKNSQDFEKIVYRLSENSAFRNYSKLQVYSKIVSTSPRLNGEVATQYIEEVVLDLIANYLELNGTVEYSEMNFRDSYLAMENFVYEITDFPIALCRFTD